MAAKAPPTENNTHPHPKLASETPEEDGAARPKAAEGNGGGKRQEEEKLKDGQQALAVPERNGAPPQDGTAKVKVFGLYTQRFASCR